MCAIICYGKKPCVRIWPGPSTDLGLMAGGTLY